MRTVNYEPLTPLLFLERSYRVFENKVAIIGDTFSKTYKEFRQDCYSLAYSLQNVGVGSGDRIAYLSKNSYELLLAHYGVAMLGAILVTLNVRQDEQSINYILKHSGTKILFIEEEFLKESYFANVEKVVILNKINSTHWPQNIENYDCFFKTCKVKSLSWQKNIQDEISTIAINYTTGTTGNPKGVEICHRSVYLNAFCECIQGKLNSQSKFLHVLPMFHCNAWSYAWAVTAIGACHVFLKTTNAKAIVASIINQKITHFCAAPTVLINLMQDPSFQELRNYQGLNIITAGASPCPRIIKTYEDMGVNIIHVFGMTETHGPHLICERQKDWDFASEDELAEIKIRQGVPGIHSVFAKVVDKNMQEVPWDGNTLGEIVMRGNNVMKGYYKDPVTTEQSFRNGWFHSGDLAVIHPDGYIEIKGREKDIIISGGENVSIAEVENMLYSHPDIAIASVITIQDEKWGERPHAVIKLKNGAPDLKEDDIINFCREHLAHYKCPAKVTFWDNFPMSNDKVQRELLKQEVEDYYAQK